MRHTLALAFALTLGCHVHSYVDPEGPRYAGLAEDPAEDPERELRVVTFNVEFSRHVDRAVEALGTRESLRTADVLLLQEMNEGAIETIAAARRMSYVYYPATERGSGGFGNAVASRWPIIEDHKILLPHPSPANGERRVAVAAMIDAPSGPLVAVSVHSETPWMPMRGRLEQLAAILEDVDASYPGTVPAIIAGDMNTPEDWGADMIRTLFGRHGFRHASRRVPPTADYFVQQVTLDYVFVRGVRVEEAGVEHTEASDHRPVWIVGHAMAP